jgi:von Willebrand factor type A domain-containing protein
MKKIIQLAVLVIVVGLLIISMSCSLFTSAVESLFDGGFNLAPQISTNEIDFEITGIGTGKRGYDNFPSITLFVTPKTLDGDLITGMQEADFFDVIDDNGEARPITVTPRGAVTTVNKQADIVFVIDTTGSMGSYLTTMTSKAESFADTIATSNVDFRLGFVTFGDDIRKGAGARLAPTNVVADFKAAVGALTANGGGDGPENPIDAIDYARAAAAGSNPAGSFQEDMEFAYRAGAFTTFILITDIGYHTPSSSGNVLSYYTTGVSNSVTDEIAKLNNDGISCYVVGPADGNGYGGHDYESLAEDTGGVLFDSDDSATSDFSIVLDSISAAITTRGDYMITFMTNDFSEDQNSYPYK